MTSTLTLIAAALVAAPAFAQDQITQFNIGVLGGENAQDRMSSNECLRKYTEDALGVPVKLFTPADYDGVIQRLLGGSLDAAILGASGYAKACLTNPESVEPVLVKTNLDGATTYYSIGFARKDHDIASMAGMKGKVLGFGDPNSTSGYLIPAVEMPLRGYSMVAGEYFKDIKFTGVTWADGLGDWEDGDNSGALRKAVDAGLVDMNDLVEIWRAKPIPEGPMVVRKALPADVKEQFVSLVQNLIETDTDCAYGVVSGETAGFAPVTHEAYATIPEVRKLEEQKGN